MIFHFSGFPSFIGIFHFLMAPKKKAKGNSSTVASPTPVPTGSLFSMNTLQDMIASTVKTVVTDLLPESRRSQSSHQADSPGIPTVDHSREAHSVRDLGVSGFGST